MATIPKLDENSLQQISNIIGDTNAGLTGSEIGKLLTQCGISEVDPSLTKRIRLFEALRHRQDMDACANNVFAFIHCVVDPIRYTSVPDVFRDRRQSLNTVLAFRGYEIGNDGKIRAVEKVTNLDEAHQRANRLQSELFKRKVHSQVLRYCKSEFLQENHFHAVFEAVKGIADRIREMTLLTEDGGELIDKVFNVDKPYLALSTLRTETEKSEQRGFINLLKGTFGVFRNVPAHAAKIKWPIHEEEALDLMTLVSLIHKKLDKAALVRQS